MSAPIKLLAALLASTLFRPWQSLRAPAIQNPWLGAIVLVSALWSLRVLLPQAFALQLSAACLLVLMLGWPLAIWTLALVSLVLTTVSPLGIEQAVWLGAWQGVVPATLGLAWGLATRRFMPRHLMVYILGRGFLATGLAVMSTAGMLHLAHPASEMLDTEALVISHVLMAWGEAFATGLAASRGATGLATGGGVTPPSSREPSGRGGSIRFLMRTLAKVPRIITSWLPRRAP